MLDAESDGSGELVTERFDAYGLVALRRLVARAAGAVGLVGERVDDVVMAVNEVATNAIAHAGGRGILRIWARRNVLVCEVTDAGSGLRSELPGPGPAPPSAATSGRGLWLARQVATVTVMSRASGTTVRLAFALRRAEKRDDSCDDNRDQGRDDGRGDSRGAGRSDHEAPEAPPADA